jgi:hypothetical protein
LLCGNQSTRDKHLTIRLSPRNFLPPLQQHHHRFLGVLSDTKVAKNRGMVMPSPRWNRKKKLERPWTREARSLNKVKFTDYNNRHFMWSFRSQKIQKRREGKDE